MIMYGSYLKEDAKLLSSSYVIVFAQLVVGLLSSIAIFSVVFTKMTKGPQQRTTNNNNNKHFEAIFPTLVGVSLLLHMTEPSISLHPLHHFSPNL